MDEFEEWLSVDRQVTKLVMKRDHVGARHLLRESAHAAAAKEQFEAASHFANQLGSLSAADKLDDEALAAYSWAENLCPNDGTLKITTANFFLLFRNEPIQAIEKIEEAIRLVTNDPLKRYALTDAYAIKAVAKLELGDSEYAVAQFREWSAPDRLERTPSGSCDLRLARALWEKNVLRSEVATYLKSVLAKSEREGNDHMTGEVRRVLAALGAG